MKRVFGLFEAVFDLCYLAAALLMGAWLLLSSPPGGPGWVAGIMALVLAGGDAFHLLPRIAVIFTGDEETYRPALGRGKQVTSITMTVFYLLLWQIGLMFFSLPEGWTVAVYLLAGVRIALCLLPQNRWQDRYPPVFWGILRNIPFFLLGAFTAVFFFLNRNVLESLGWIWLAVLLSFVFYFPVVLWSRRNPKIGMLMLPKTCAYLWMLAMCLSL